MYERIQATSQADLWNKIGSILEHSTRFAYPRVTVDTTKARELSSSSEELSLLEVEKLWEQDHKSLTDAQFALYCEVSHFFLDELDSGEDVTASLTTFQLPRDERYEKLIRIAVTNNTAFLWTELHTPGGEFVSQFPMIPLVTPPPTS